LQMQLRISKLIHLYKSFFLSYLILLESALIYNFSPLSSNQMCGKSKAFNQNWDRDEK
jgi:hypothetical protein